MNSLFQAFSSDNKVANQTVPKLGIQALYYGHCRWCLVILASGLWCLTTGYIDLVPVVAFFVYLFGHYPSKWFSAYRSKHRTEADSGFADLVASEPER